MIMNKEKIKLNIVELVSLIGSILYLIGIRICFPVCKVTGDMIMSCHWAGETLKALSVLITGLAVIHILLRNYNMKVGIDISLIGIYILTLNVPGRIISLCVKEGMTCRAKTMTMTIVFCVVLILLAAVDIFLCLSKEADTKHRRPN